MGLLKNGQLVAWEGAGAVATSPRAMPQARAKMVRNVQPEKTFEVSDAVELMTREQFDALKADILPALRARGDPPPRILEPGKGERTRWFANIKELLASTPGGTLVRGYKLFIFPLNLRVWHQYPWKAQFHVVVARKSESGKLIYTCPNSSHHSSAAETPFIFVPSSRAHTEVSDADMLENKFIFGAVVGGNPAYTDAFVLDKRLRGRRFSVIATCPEECVAKRNVAVWLLPYFREWFKTRKVQGDMHNLAEQMGMPCGNVGVNDDFRGEDITQLMERVQNNEESLVNGTEGLKMELNAVHDLFTRQATIDEVRLAFFGYYDETKAKVDEIIRQRLCACQRLQKLQ